MHYLIDSHAHITCEQLIPENKVKLILDNAREANISAILNICTDAGSLAKGVKLNESAPVVYNAAAITPHDVSAIKEDFLHTIEQYASEKKIIAIGETGLDCYYKNSAIDLQKKLFKKHLQIAQNYKLPVIIHCREAFDDLFRILDSHYKGPAIIHCFTGNATEALSALERNIYLSFSGIITFKNSDALRAVVAQVPLNRILIETDSPYLAPQKYRGKDNQPAYIIEIAQKIAEIKGISIEEVAKTTSQNFYEAMDL